MTISWGAWKYAAGNGMRVGIEAFISSVDHSSATVTVTANYYTQNQHNYNDNQVIEYGGSYDHYGSSYGHSGGLTNNSSPSTEVLRATHDFVYPYSSGSYTTSPDKLTLTLEVRSTYNGVVPTKTLVVTIPARPPIPPAALTAFSAVRDTDSQVNLAWTRNSTSPAPYTSLEIQRQANGSDWAPLETVAGTATFYYDNNVRTNTAYKYRVRAVNVAGPSAWVESAVVPMTPGAPALVSPSDPGWEFTSASKVRLYWTNTVAYSGYRTYVHRWNGTTWIALGYAAEGLTSYTDTAPLSGLSQYRVRVEMSGPGGIGVNSAWLMTDTVNTIPGAPTLVKASFRPGSVIRVRWVNNVAYPDYTITVKRGNSGFVSLGTTTMVSGLPAGTVEWTDTTPGLTGPQQYQVFAVGINGQLSAPTGISNNVGAIAPPFAPSELSPASVTLDLDKSPVFSWHYNPNNDYADQTAFQLRFSTDSGVTWTELAAVTSDVASWTMPPGTLTNGPNRLWQVRTKGLDPTYSSWSSSALFSSSTTPVVALLTPTDPLYAWPLTVSWTYTQPEADPQHRSQVELYPGTVIDPGQLIESHETFSVGTAVVFDYPVTNGATFTVRVRAQSTHNLWSDWVEQTFTVDLLPPAEVTVTPVFDQGSGTMVVELAADAPAMGVTAQVVSVDLQRRIDGGDWLTIVSTIDLYPEVQTVLDTAPITNGLNEYRVIALSVSPSTGISDPVGAVVDGLATGQWLYLSYGAGFANIVRARCDPATKLTVSRVRGSAATQGRRKPTLLAGEQRTLVVTASATLAWGSRCGVPADASSTDRDFERASEEADLVLYRDYRGRRIFGVLGADVDIDDQLPHMAAVSFTVTEVDYTETGYTLGGG